MDNWIYPFKGRNSSWSMNQNFLWNIDNIYIMDNHRAALWCWVRHLKHNEKHSLFHIDAHYDTRPISSKYLKIIPDLELITFDDYLGIGFSQEGESIPLILWDNYLYIYEAIYRKQISEFFLATHGIGTPPPDTIHWEELHMGSLAERFSDHLQSYANSGWILNIDLDYFFSRQPESFSLLHSESYLCEIFHSIKKALDSDLISCLTICLSPECCGGWEPSEKLCYRLCDEIGIDFRLPK